MRIFWVLTFMVLALPALADAEQKEARHGLMWNRTGLPAVFPLQVKTVAGRDMYLTLRDPETGEPALAAYIEGGRFFAVLVPPGTFSVRFAIGTDWQGEDDLFGAGDATEVLKLALPLTFAVRNFTTKEGHMIDLRDLAPGREARIDIVPKAICQTSHLVPGFGYQGAAQVWRKGADLPDRLEFPNTPLERQQDALGLGLAYPEGGRVRLKVPAVPRYEFRTRPCEPYPPE